MTKAAIPAALYARAVAALEADHDPAWRERAACKGSDPDLWITEGRGGNTSEASDMARCRAVCEQCPVAAPCLADALLAPPSQSWGVWSATSDNQRRRLRTALRASGVMAAKPEPIEPRHGSGTTAYVQCKRRNGIACALCKAGHAAEVDLRAPAGRWRNKSRRAVSA